MTHNLTYIVSALCLFASASSYSFNLPTAPYYGGLDVGYTMQHFTLGYNIKTANEATKYAAKTFAEGLEYGLHFGRLHHTRT